MVSICVCHPSYKPCVTWYTDFAYSLRLIHMPFHPTCTYVPVLYSSVKLTKHRACRIRPAAIYKETVIATVQYSDNSTLALLLKDFGLGRRKATLSWTDRLTKGSTTSSSFSSFRHHPFRRIIATLHLLPFAHVGGLLSLNTPAGPFGTDQSVHKLTITPHHLSFSRVFRWRGLLTTHTPTFSFLR